ncbi:uncharacterized protein LOC132932285 isoform X2 [Rhopalosiphum padi]|uniref:uncharacterized protein LOC132932285 isoform X2 n=1 Tax=Rhopalosiphum padi TaxID=40932 RepID=UPI00298DEEDA|nr:uncharacterized protein LOC132932285 isoform X2 [Rhopalosiphum padi]
MLTLSYLAWPYVIAAKNKLFSDRKMKEPERKDNEKISEDRIDYPVRQLSTETAAHATSEAAAHATTETAGHATSEAAAHATSEAAALSTSEAAAHATLEAAAQSTSEAATHAATEARVRRMCMQELLRDPALWVAYTRGWDDCAGKATNVNPKPAVTDRSQSPRRPVQPAGTSRPPPIPQSARLPRPPPPTANGSTGPTTKIFQTANTARDEESQSKKCPKATDNSAITRLVATPEPVSDCRIPGTEKGRKTHHLPTVPPRKTGTLNHPTGTRPKVAGGNDHACPPDNRRYYSVIDTMITYNTFVSSIILLSSRCTT